MLEGSVEVDLSALNRESNGTGGTRWIHRTELRWIRSIMDDIETGRLTWSQEWLTSLARH